MTYVMGGQLAAPQLPRALSIPSAPMAPMAPAMPALPTSYGTSYNRSPLATPAYGQTSAMGLTLPTLPTSISSLPTTIQTNVASLSSSFTTPSTYGGTLGTGAPTRIAAGGGIAALVAKLTGAAGHSRGGWGGSVGHAGARAPRGGNLGGGSPTGGSIPSGGGTAGQSMRYGARTSRSYSSTARNASRSYGSTARNASRSRSMAGAAGGGGFLKALGLSALITVPLVAISDYMDYKNGKTTAGQRNTLIVADSVGYTASGGVGAMAGAMVGGIPGMLVGLGVGAVLSWGYENFLRPHFPGGAS